MAEKAEPPKTVQHTAISKYLPGSVFPSSFLCSGLHEKM